jgi:hypothetical protein
MISSFSRFGATITVPGETEAGSAGMRPCRGIAWWAHRDDVVGTSEFRSTPLPHSIGSVDPDALKIPARRAEFTLTENARIPFHAEPEHTLDKLLSVPHDELKKRMEAYERKAAKNPKRRGPKRKEKQKRLD